MQVHRLAAVDILQRWRERSDEPVQVVGHSFGGQVALDMALIAPEWVSTLTMLCSRATPFPPFAAVAAGLRSGEPVSAEATVRRWFTPAELRAGGPVIQAARSAVQTADPQEWATSLDAISCYDRTGQVAGLQMPVRLLAAELDPVSDPATMRALADQIPGSEFSVLPGAAHMSPFVDPAALATRITAR